MSQPLANKISRWLRLSGIPVSTVYLEEKLKSHSDFPSLLSITDVLTETGIETHSLVVDKNRFDEIPIPFLAHIKEKAGDFVVVSNRQKTLADPRFMDKWDGVVVIAQPTTGFTDPHYNRYLQEKRRQNAITAISITLMAVIAAAALLIAFSQVSVILVISAIAGMAISFLLVRQEMGITNGIADELCSFGNNTDCHKVITAPKPSLLKWLNLPDICLVWFVSQSLLLLVSVFTGKMASIIPVLVLAAFVSLPVTLISIYLQWKVIKKWCTLCLGVIAILWIQAIALLPFTSSIAAHTTWMEIIMLTVLTMNTVAITWLVLLTPALKKNRHLQGRVEELLRFRNNAEMFNTLLTQQRRILPFAWKEDIQTGNPDAAVQLIIACNPYCNPCAKAHIELSHLADRGDIGLVIRFAVRTDEQSPKTEAVLYLLQILKDKDIAYRRKVLHDWYTGMNMDTFKSKYPLQSDEDDITPLAKKHEEWSMTTGILFTPTIFINGYELPKGYMASDLPLLINRIDLTISPFAGKAAIKTNTSFTEKAV